MVKTRERDCRGVVQILLSSSEDEGEMAERASTTFVDVKRPEPLKLDGNCG